MQNSVFIASLLLIFLVLSQQAPRDDIPGREALNNFPLIDGHNDLPWNLHNKLQNQISNFSFENDLSNDPVWGLKACNSCFTDLPRIRKGKLGAQFWVAYVSCNPVNYNSTVSLSFEQVDVIKRLIEKYPNDLEFVTAADGIEAAFRNNKTASLIGLEGGHSIDNKMALLRQFYELGVRYMTLTHSCNLAWADASPVDGPSGSPAANLTAFGRKIVLEMNRLGMLVDLSHVSHNVMSQAIDIAKAPVIFSHSSAHAIRAHHRNVKDDVLLKVKENGGIVMVNFYSGFVAAANATINDVIKHINHIADIAGVDHVGIGADYDGVDEMPEGLEDVSKYADLFDLLKTQNPQRWTIENLEKLAGRNFVRVFKKAEQVRDSLQNEQPNEDVIPAEDVIKTEKNSAASITSTFTLITLLVIFY